jgi:hypothetical protein
VDDRGRGDLARRPALPMVLMAVCPSVLLIGPEVLQGAGISDPLAPQGDGPN